MELFMPRVPLTGNVLSYRAHVGFLLFAGIAVLTSWVAFTSSSAKLNKSIKPAKSSQEVSGVPLQQPDGDSRATIHENYGNLPLSFEANRGQTDASVNFVARGPGYNIFLTPGEAVLAFRTHDQNSKDPITVREADELNGVRGARFRQRELSSEVGEAASAKDVKGALVRMRLENANPNPTAIAGADELPGKVNYFHGNDSSKWLTNIPTYSKVAYRGVYPGIDIVYYGNGRELEYDLVVQAGADPNAIKVKYDGMNDLNIGRDGNLILKTKAGDIQLKKPLVYQEINGARKLIDGRYVTRGANSVGFRVAQYDRTKPLVIDPILSYLSLVNADGNGYAIAVDNNGFAYIAGTVSELNTTVSVSQSSAGGGGYDAFVTKLNQDGTNVIYSTYLGGNGEEEAYGLAVDAPGNAYITGYASGTFPTTPGAIQTVSASAFDCFVTKLNPSGSALVYSTFYGGNDFDEGVGIAVDAAGNAYVTGDTRSSNLVTTPGALQSANAGGADGFILRLNSDGSLGYATYLGGGGFDLGIGIAVDSSSNAYVTGQTASFNYSQVNSLQGPQGTDRGLFRSTNNGANWNLSNTGLTTSFVYSIVIDRNTPTTIYAGTAGGVSKSTDGGVTWVTTGPTNGTVRTLAIDPSNSSIIYAGTASGVYKTTNGGASWMAINNGMVVSFASGSGTFPVTIRNLVIDPGNPNTVYAGSSSGIYKSTDGGANWFRLTSGLPSSNIQTVVIDPANPAMLYVGLNSLGVFKSTNSGANWTAANTGLSNLSIRSLAMAPNDPNTLYAGTLNGIFKTTNGGTSWSAVNNGLLTPYTDSVSRIPAAINAIVIDPVTPTNVYAAASSQSFGNGFFGLTSILKTTDGGANWNAVTNGFGSLNNNVASLAINPTNPSQVYAGNFGDADGFAAKINPSGTSLVYSTYIGSNRSDYGIGIAADSAGNAYVCGVVSGTNLPTTAVAMDTNLSGTTDVFVTKLSSAGTSRLYSTYLGGNDIEDSYGLAVDSAGNAYVTGLTYSTNFPVTSGSFQTTKGGRSSNNSDAFITKLNSTGTAAVYSSYLGGAGFELDGFFDYQGNNIALDATGNAYVVGGTSDRNIFPLLGYANAFTPTSGPSTTFVAKVDGNTPAYSINGRVTTAGGVPIAGVFLEARTDLRINAREPRIGGGATDSQGFYSIINLPAKTYRVFAHKFDQKSYYLFNPFGGFADLSSSDNTLDLTGYPVYPIRGRVTSSTNPNEGISGVTMTLSGSYSQQTTTDAAGNFILGSASFTNPVNLTVTPSKAGLTFDPVNISYTTVSADQPAANFTTAAAVADTFFSVSGHVADLASPNLSGATITMLSNVPGFSYQSVVTDANGNYSFQNLPPGGNYTFSASKTDRTFAPPSSTFFNLSGNQTLNFTASPAAFQSTLKTWTISGRTYVYVKLAFPNAGFSVSNWGTIFRNVNDFESSITVQTDPGPSVQAATTTAQIYDLGPVANGNYTYTLKDSLGVPLNLIAFSVTSAVPPPNPIDDAQEFVKQHYRDFLNREADPAGLAFWTDNITRCSDPARRPAGQTEAQCTLRQRETTSAAFFLSPEFQGTGYYVYRIYVGALRRKPKLSEFTADAFIVRNGILDHNNQLNGGRLDMTKRELADDFANCTDAAKQRCVEFKAIYGSMTNEEYVNQLFLNTGVNASATDRAALISDLNGGTNRGNVLRRIVDGVIVESEAKQLFTTSYGQAFYSSQLSEAFVQMEYFGYLKRDPDDEGYAFWLAKLNSFGGNFLNSEMVLAFITSPEYRARFGQP
jgi:photosystem II stability/assembly factor-like uncharacterized protein